MSATETVKETSETVKIKTTPPEEVVVVNGESWKCPVYARKMPPCRSSCPASEDIRGYLTGVARAAEQKTSLETAFDEAWYLLTDKNPFPAIHGRICPHPCEGGCNRKYKEDGAVAINSFERVVGDHGLKRDLRLRSITSRKRTERIAVVGSGPSGLSCAYQCARRGYQVTVFESEEKPGGMLRYGIPSYRLPREVLDAEIANVLRLGIELKCKTRVGKDISFDDLRKDFSAVYIAVGAQKGGAMKIPGEEMPQVWSGVDFLRKVNSGGTADLRGKSVAVIGGGNTAIDAARVSLRLGANVTIVYRRTKDEMPAIGEEIHSAEAEGIKFRFLTAPVRINAGNGKGSVKLVCVQMKLGEKDSSGRARPVPIQGSDHSLDIDVIISAIGQEPDLAGMDQVPNKQGWVSSNSSRETGLPGVFSGGDAVTMDLAVTAVGHGRKAARAIDAYLNGLRYVEPPAPKPIRHTEMDLTYYPELPRQSGASLPMERRVSSFDEINLALTAESAASEAVRCMSCGLCFSCDRCRVYCPKEAISKNRHEEPGKVMFSDYTRCSGCHICHDVCPCGYIEMGMGL